ncbi:nucleotidyltransferase family protein [Phenylobacterium soli]|uniref:cGAS/DncV-like nucleotidyltransferase C-terminal helical domain-containing protein n=1 Tax=Phenylobacterium soli TaxID=2170551 RepID=A0A328AKZ1_9CAUL|nr:hypothetical protein [Phenylobacterium soli]RAK55572.1 hypothetical protein DJ017_14170 [Phenylobacterium soli]
MTDDNPFRRGLGGPLGPDPFSELSGLARFTDPPPNALSAFSDLARMTGQTNSLSELARLVASPAPPATGLGLPMTSSLAQALSGELSYLGGLGGLEKYRQRREWNARFEHWEKPASTTEESTLDRAQRMVREAIAGSVWLREQGATVQPQGSYHNNTNTRLDADADLRVQLPLIKVDYHPNVTVPYARSLLGLTDSSWSFDQLFTMLRWELETLLGEAFGKRNVTPGNKAIRVKGLRGTRAEIDVVPAVRYQNIMWWDWEARYNTIEGVALLSKDGRWTINYPDHHRASGVAKRAGTGHQFKRQVRIFKRLRGDLAQRGLLHAKVPSFLVESLVWNVEDGYFTVSGDDMYERVRRIARRLQWMVRDENTAAGMLEVNGLKKLFTEEQAWTWADAMAFAEAVVAHLGDA